jgi:hypothetical protein
MVIGFSFYSCPISLHSSRGKLLILQTEALQRGRLVLAKDEEGLSEGGRK